MSWAANHPPCGRHAWLHARVCKLVQATRVESGGNCALEKDQGRQVLAPVCGRLPAWPMPGCRNLVATQGIALISASVIPMRVSGCSRAVATRHGSSPLPSASAALFVPSRCDRTTICSTSGGQQAPPQADARRRGSPPSALSVGRRQAFELGASALLLALLPPLPSSAASSDWAPAVIRPELAPDQRLYDAADPQVRCLTRPCPLLCACQQQPEHGIMPTH